MRFKLMQPDLNDAVEYSHLAVAQLVEDVDQPGVGEAGGNVLRTEHPALRSGHLGLRLSPLYASYL